MITAVNGKSISSTDQFIDTRRQLLARQTVTITVKRGGQTQQIH